MNGHNGSVIESSRLQEEEEDPYTLLKEQVDMHELLEEPVEEMETVSKERISNVKPQKELVKKPRKKMPKLFSQFRSKNDFRNL